MADEEGAQRKEGDKLRKRFDALSQVLANTLQEILDEADAGELPTSSDDDDAQFEFSLSTRVLATPFRASLDSKIRQNEVPGALRVHVQNNFFGLFPRRFRRATNARLSCATRRARGDSNVREGCDTTSKV